MRIRIDDHFDEAVKARVVAMVAVDPSDWFARTLAAGIAERDAEMAAADRESAIEAATRMCRGEIDRRIAIEIDDDPIVRFVDAGYDGYFLISAWVNLSAQAYAECRSEGEGRTG